MWAMFISFSFMMFLNMVMPLGFVGGIVVFGGVYLLLTKVLNFQEV